MTSWDDRMRVDDLARVLSVLGMHANEMELLGEAEHDPDCLVCQTTILFSRVARFGMQLRERELEEYR